TAEYLDRISAIDPRLKVVHNAQSVGAPASRNTAIMRSAGMLVTGIDDDDAFHPLRIEKLVEAWQTEKSKGTQFSCLFTQDKFVAPDATETSQKPASVRYHELFSYNTIGNQIFTTRQRMIDAGLFDEQMPAWQDLDMFMRVLHKFGQALLVD